MTTDTVSLPPLDGHDDYEKDLGWHALNYRTAHTLHAQEAYEELEKFVRSYALLAVQEERERCARVAEQKRDEWLLVKWPDNLEDFGKRLIASVASAIRSQQP